jgi:hypothetical protein
LALLGFVRDLPERRPGFDGRFGKEASLRDIAFTEIDVHRVLSLGAFGLRLDAEALWAAHASFSVAGIEVHALDAEARFVHACVNAVVGDARPRLVALRDVALIARRTPLERRRLDQLVPPGRGTVLVRRALELCASTLGVELRGVVTDVASAPVSRWERAALRTYRSTGGTNTLELLGGVLGTSGFTDAAAYLWAVVVPGADYRRARRARGRPAEWRTGARELFRRRSP